MIQTPQLSISKRGLFSSLGILASALLLSGCQDEDYGYTADQIAFRTQFEQNYGKIDPNQTWDFSSYGLQLAGLVGGPSKSPLTRGGNPVSPDGVRTFATYSGSPLLYDVETTTKDWLDRELTERLKHNALGESFKLLNKKDAITGQYSKYVIIPIYQGQTGMTWDLHLVADNNDYNIWSKSQGIRYTEDFNNVKGEEYHYRNESDTKKYINFSYEINDNDDDRADHLEYYNPFRYLSGKGDIDVDIRFELPSKDPDGNTITDSEIQGHFEVWNQADNKNYRIPQSLLSGNESGFTFTLANNGTSFTDSRNKVSLRSLRNGSRDKTFTSGETTVTIFNDLSNVKFVPESKTKCSIYTYSADHVRMYVKYDAFGSTPSPIDLEQDHINSYYDAHTISKFNVQSQVMVIDGEMLNGEDCYLYLKITHSDKYNENYAREGTEQRSDRGMMLAFTDFGSSTLLDQEKLDAIVGKALNQDMSGKDCKYMVVGCEDANGKSGDKDYNDVVFLIAGYPTLPELKKDIVQKRYMVEDLGNTYDFDFNDIIVDVTQESVKEGGEFVTKQTAAIKFLCGTIPFQLFIDENPITPVMEGRNGSDGSGFDPATDPTGTYVFDIPSTHKWNPNTNNFSILVWPKKKYSEFTTDYTSLDPIKQGVGGNNSTNETTFNVDVKGAERIEFPKQGNYPYIIAFDTDIRWMPEGEAIPRDWFKTSNTTDLDNYDNEEINPNPHPYPDPDNTNFNNLYELGTLIPYNSNYFTRHTTKDYYYNSEIVNLDNVINNVITYRDGRIVLNFVVPFESPSFTEVKASLRLKTDDNTKLISDSIIELKDFETRTINGQGFKVKSVILPTETKEFIETYKADNNTDVQMWIRYSTFDFNTTQNSSSGHTRIYASSSASYGTLTSENVNADRSVYGKKLDLSNASSVAFPGNSNWRRIILSDYMHDNDYVSGDIKVTIVVPAGKISNLAQFSGRDNNGSFASDQFTLDNRNGETAKAYTFNLSSYFENTDVVYNESDKFKLDYFGNFFDFANGDVEVYVNWNNYVKDVPIPDHIGENFVYGSENFTTASGGYKQVQLKSMLTDYNGTDDIIVTVVNPSQTKITGNLNSYPSWQHMSVDVPAGSYRIYTLSAQEYKNMVKADNGTVYLEVYGGSGKFDLPSTDLSRPRIYISTLDTSNFGNEFKYTASNISKPYNTRVDISSMFADYNGLDDITISLVAPIDGNANGLLAYDKDANGTINGQEQDNNNLNIWQGKNPPTASRTYTAEDIRNSAKNGKIAIDFIDGVGFIDPTIANPTRIFVKFTAPNLAITFDNSSWNGTGTGVSFSVSGDKTVEDGVLKVTSKAIDPANNKDANNDDIIKAWDTALTFSFGSYNKGDKFEISFDYWRDDQSCNNLWNSAQTDGSSNYASVLPTGSPFGTLSPTTTKQHVSVVLDTNEFKDGLTMSQISIQLNGDKDNNQHVFYFDNVRVKKQ